MLSDSYFKSMHNLSPQLSNRSDRRSTHEHESVGGRGDFSGGNVHLDGQPPSVKSSKTSVHDGKFSERPTFIENQANWKKSDYDHNINLLFNEMVNQKQYLKHCDEKYARNRELLARIKTMRQEDYDDTVKKNTETKRLKKEIEGFDWQIKHQSALAETSTIRFLAEQTLNKDILKQKKRLSREKDFQLKKEIEEGILPDIVEQYESAKGQLEMEQNRRRRMEKKVHWYDTELANMKELFDKHVNADTKQGIQLPLINNKTMHTVEITTGDQERMHNDNVKHILPEINKGRNNLVTLQALESNGNNSSDGSKKIQQADDTDKVYLPKPPSAQKKESYHRFHRKLRNVVK